MTLSYRSAMRHRAALLLAAEHYRRVAMYAKRKDATNRHWVAESKEEAIAAMRIVLALGRGK